MEPSVSPYITKKIKLGKRKKKRKPMRPLQSLPKWIRVVIVSLFCLLLLVLFVFIAFPILFRLSTVLQRYLLFMNQVKDTLPNPLNVGLNQCTKQVFLQSDDDIKLGVWYIPPDEQNCTLNKMKINNRSSEHWLVSDERLVVLFTHGIKGSRGTSNRIFRYKVYSNSLHFHVVTFDYRGFGDSTLAPPSASALINDTWVVYKWLLANGVSPKRILLWGHSLGTAVAVRFLSTLPDMATNPLGTVLETSFPDIGQVLSALISRTPYLIFPFADYFFVRPIVTNPEFNFNSTQLMPLVKCALLMMHSRDDHIIPFELGRQLFESALQMQPNEVRNRAIFVDFAPELNYGHNLVITDPNIPQIVQRFIETNQQAANDQNIQ